MRQVCLAVALALAATGAGAEMQDEHVVIGPEQIWIEMTGPVESLWVGRNEYARIQVLSGADIEIAAFATDADSVALLGAKALVAVVPGTHTCENSGDAWQYHVVTLGDQLATDGPLTSCVELVVSVVPGGIVLEEDPTGEGEFWAWLPGKGFRERLD